MRVNIFVYITILIIVFYVSKYLMKTLKKEEKKHNKNISNEIKSKWNKIQIKTSDCDVFMHNEIVGKRNTVTEDDNFFNWLDKKNSRDFTNVKFSKIICYQKSEDGKIINTFENVVDMDNTVLEFKLRMRDFIDVYIDNKAYSISENNDEVLSRYYIDLDFLDTEITSI